MKWIAIKDKMPEVGKKVLCLMQNGTMLVGFRFPLYNMWRSQSDAQYVADIEDEPVYWMPLPNMPDNFSPQNDEDCYDVEQTLCLAVVLITSAPLDENRGDISRVMCVAVRNML